MPSNRRGGNLNGVAAGLLVLAVLSMLFFAFWLQKHGRGDRHPGSRTMGVMSGSTGFASDDETDAAELDTLIQGRKAAIGQITPGARDFMPADDSPPRPISRDFHKLPDEYFLPQTPDTTIRAAERIRELRETSPQQGLTRDAGTPGSGKKGSAR